MAIKNNKYRTDFAVGVDSKEASTGFKQILRITSFFVVSMNKLLSKVGAIQREKIRRTPIENILQDKGIFLFGFSLCGACRCCRSCGGSGRPFCQS